MRPTKLDLKKKRIREFFSTFKTKTKDKTDLDEVREQVFKEGMVYVQMRLPVNEITQEFEDSLKERIEKNFIHAKIREASSDDLHIIMDLYNKSWLTTNTPFRPISVGSLESIFEDADTVFLIARVYGIDAGFVILDFEGPNKEYGIIAGLGVIPRFQRRGLGTVLGMAAWNYFKENSVKELRCEVYKDNLGSQSFIKWIGFKEYEKRVYRKKDFLLDEEVL
ncbi:MAG: GNAT family N-acetyltransferase [Candidatus Lokiarchaeota archaeon]|nr:GNAT family N-acetyltransferase [Candidatus Lokiarchaeota archaeon]MBD3338971.1 GNAT family N-acetyltransferase [Candidatus Lokiarchaeota archaeon]